MIKWQNRKMKTIFGIIFMLNMFGTNTNKFIEITDDLSIQEFEEIKTFILKNGDRQTYRNYPI